MAYGYVYKCILSDGRYYIGQRKFSGNPLKDKYFGSGTKWRNILKNKDEMPKKIILEIAESEEELNSLEYKLIGDKYESDPLCMNLCEGGGSRSGYHLSEEQKQNLSEKCSGWHHSDKAKAVISKTHKGTKRSDQTKEKMSKALVGNKNGTGNQSGKGKHWFNDGKTNIFSKTCPEGYNKGRINMKWFNKGEISHAV